MEFNQPRGRQRTARPSEFNWNEASERSSERRASGPACDRASERFADPRGLERVRAQFVSFQIRFQILSTRSPILERPEPWELPSFSAVFGACGSDALIASERGGGRAREDQSEAREARRSNEGDQNGRPWPGHALVHPIQHQQSAATSVFHWPYVIMEMSCTCP